MASNVKITLAGLLSAVGWFAIACFIESEYRIDMAPKWEWERNGGCMLIDPHLSRELELPAMAAGVAILCGSKRWMLYIGAPTLLVLAYQIAMDCVVRRLMDHEWTSLDDMVSAFFWARLIFRSAFVVFAVLGIWFEYRARRKVMVESP